MICAAQKGMIEVADRRATCPWVAPTAQQQRDFLSGDDSCIHGERRCGNPEVVLIQQQSAALLRNLDFRVQIAGGRRDWLTRYMVSCPTTAL
jgi:hypothetical protein